MMSAFFFYLQPTLAGCLTIVSSYIDIGLALLKPSFINISLRRKTISSTQNCIQIPRADQPEFVVT